MANQKRGRQSFVLAQPPVITAWANVAGKKEVEGPLASFLLQCSRRPARLKLKTDGKTVSFSN